MSQGTTQASSIDTEAKPVELAEPPMSPRELPRNFSGPYRRQTNGVVDLDDYFVRVLCYLLFLVDGSVH